MAAGCSDGTRKNVRCDIILLRLTGVNRGFRSLLLHTACCMQHRLVFFRMGSSDSLDQLRARSWSIGARLSILTEDLYTLRCSYICNTCTADRDDDDDVVFSSCFVIIEFALYKVPKYSAL